MRLLLYAALLPPLILMYLVYREDKIEAEPVNLIRNVIIFGAISCIPAILLEIVMEYPLYAFFEEGSLVAVLFENLIGVALIEELCKFAAAYTVWKKPEFNYRFDGVVYCVAASMGFAAFENVLYVFGNGLETALMRALLSIPGHCIFGIYMGVYFGEAKYLECRNNPAGKTFQLIKAIAIPVLLHGTYDALLSLDNDFYIYAFYAFVIILDLAGIMRIRKSSKEDRAFYEQEPVPEWWAAETADVQVPAGSNNWNGNNTGNNAGNKM